MLINSFKMPIISSSLISTQYNIREIKNPFRHIYRETLKVFIQKLLYFGGDYFSYMKSILSLHHTRTECIHPHYCIYQIQELLCFLSVLILRKQYAVLCSSILPDSTCPNVAPLTGLPVHALKTVNCEIRTPLTYVEPFVRVLNLPNSRLSFP